MSKARNSIYLVAASVFASGLQFLAVRYYVHWLSDSAWGLYAAVLAAGGYLNLASFNVGIGAQNRIAQSFHEKDNEQAWRVQSCLLGLALLTAAIGLGIALLLGAFFTNLLNIPAGDSTNEVPWMFAIIGAEFVLLIVGGTFGILQAARDRYGVVAARRVINRFTSVILSLIFCYYYRTPLALFAGSFVGSTVGFIFNLGTLKITDPDFRFRPVLDWKIAKDLLGIGVKGYPHRIFNMIATSADRLILTGVLGTVAMGAYAKAYRLPEGISNVLQPLNEPVTPHLARAHKSEPHMLAKLVNRFSLIGLAVGVSTVLIIGGFGQPLLTLWLGSKAPVNGDLIALFIAIYFCFEFYYIACSKIFYSAGEMQWLAPFSAFNAIATLIFTYPVAMKYGIVGVAVQNMIVAAVQIIPRVVIIRKTIIKDFPVLNHLKQVFGSLAIGSVFCAGAFYISHTEQLTQHPWYSLPLGLVSAALCAFTLMVTRLTPVPYFLGKRIPALRRLDPWFSKNTASKSVDEPSIEILDETEDANS